MQPQGCIFCAPVGAGRSPAVRQFRQAYLNQICTVGAGGQECGVWRQVQVLPAGIFESNMHRRSGWSRAQSMAPGSGAPELAGCKVSFTSDKLLLSPMPAGFGEFILIWVRCFRYPHSRFGHSSFVPESATFRLSFQNLHSRWTRRTCRFPVRGCITCIRCAM
jgi:hypothetical protein